MMDYFTFINVDIRLKILSQLSARDLLNLKCVSKEWKDIISNRSFVHYLSKRSETVSGFFFQERFQWCAEDIKHISYIPIETKTTGVHTTAFNFLPESVVLLSSCNGLICCRCTFPSSNPLIHVCNPLNKEWKSIEWSNPSKATSIALSFDPLQIQEGDDALTNFKLVAMSQTEAEAGNEESHFTFSVFSSETGEWRRSGEICHCKHNMLKNKGIFAGGLLYWLTDGNQIIMFDPQQELSFLIAMPLPETDLCTLPEICIGESKGKLHYVLLSDDGLQLWVLVDHFESQWDLTFSVPLDELERENSEFLYNIASKLARRSTIDMVPQCIDLLAFKDGVLLTRVCSDVYSFNFESRKLKKICKLVDLGRNSFYAPIVLPYAMSLVPLV